jgi:hypothetical protein
MLITLEIDVTGLRSRSNTDGVYVDGVDNTGAPSPRSCAPVIAAVAGRAA